jgi:hypothetical protein
MTSKELLQRLVDDLGEPQAAEALTWIRAGRGDLAEKHEEILRDEGDAR